MVAKTRKAAADLRNAFGGKDVRFRSQRLSSPVGKRRGRSLLSAALVDGQEGQAKYTGAYSSWFLENSFDAQTHYGVVSNPKRNLGYVVDGADVVNTEVEQMSVAGMVPFGWDRSNCMLCWSAPIWIVNLVRLCGGENADKVGFYQEEKDAEAWPAIDKPVVYGCGDGQKAFGKLSSVPEHNQQHIFLRAKLFEGLAEEKDKLPGWSEDGMINGCGP